MFMALETSCNQNKLELSWPPEDPRYLASGIDKARRAMKFAHDCAGTSTRPQDGTRDGAISRIGDDCQPFSRRMQR